MCVLMRVLIYMYGAYEAYTRAHIYAYIHAFMHASYIVHAYIHKFECVNYAHIYIFTHTRTQNAFLHAACMRAQTTMV
jgi:hypothetical protein